MRFVFIPVFLGLTFLLGGLACADGAPPQMAAAVHIPPATPSPAVTPFQNFLADYARFFADSMRLTSTPGAAVVIVKDGEIVFQRGFGVKSEGSQDSVDAHTVFRIGSLSKGFAGVLAGALVQKGQLRWDEPVQERYPAFRLSDRRQTERIQLWHLLTHTTGLPYHAYTHLIERGYDLPTIVDGHLWRTRLAGREGEFFAYQNVAFCVAEEVMRSATGSDYAELLQREIFQPSGMTTASCSFAGIIRQDNKALPHFRSAQGWLAGDISDEYYDFAAAGGVNASAADMGQWLRLLLGYRPEIAADSTLDRVFQPAVNTGRERSVLRGWVDRYNAYYAMGWRVLERPHDQTILYHGGYVNGFRGEIALNRRDGIGICVLFNANTELTKQCVPAFFDRWERFKAGNRQI